MGETVTLKARDGAVVEGQAEVSRFSNGQRLSKALPVGIGGTLLGLGTIVIPGLHLVSTWAIPLLSWGIAWYFFNKRGSLGTVSAMCPSCGKPMQAEGGAWEDPMYVRCDKCMTPFEVAVATPV
ncbi:MAG: hypothetical protein R3F61_00790 [Myxococcota bacterium]